ncbi:IPT/TIG domain protein [Burkholderia pseudomallei]|nr:IPT/TIG domain protein [Burkholderia pseudomallei]CAJ7290351.1 IPT/TIG domain protein [Burkholderia pseudomallei]CAJ8986515.1 IPT/TIG domain protein [Burkholderia pseudomallei]
MGMRMERLGNGGRAVRVSHDGARSRRRYRPGLGSLLERSLIWLLYGLLLACGVGHAQSTRYVYDANGRVVAISANSGTTVQYGYNTLGQAGQVSAPLSAGQLAIFSFMPTHGEAGTHVTLQGQGFDSNAANNTVSFNGTPATVLSATATQLVASVPSGATTGPITVTAGVHTANSATPFMIDDTGVPPSITQVSPLAVSIGNTLTVTGMHLNPVAGQTVMQLSNRGVASFASISDTQIQYAIAAGDASGFVTINTPYGRAISANPVIVLPSGISAANVTSTAYATVGSSANLNIGAGGQTGAMVFNANEGDWISLQLSTIVSSASSISYAVYAPGSQLVAQGSVSSSAPSIHVPQLSAAGTYLVVFTPSNASAQLTVGVQRDAVLPAGTPTNVATTIPGETLRFIFAPQTLWLAVSNTSTNPSGQVVRYAVYNSNQVMYASSATSSSATLSLAPLPVTGTYQLIISPDSGVTASAQIQLLSSGTLVANASGTSYTIPAGGGSMYLNFNATAGANLDLTFSNLSVTGSGSGFQVDVYDPNGADVVSFPCSVSNVNCTADLWNLLAGPYTIVVTPPSSSSVVSFTSSLMSEITGSSLTVNSPIQLNVNENQGQRYTFTANAGDTYAMQLSGVSGQTMGVRIYSPSSPVTLSGYYTTFSTNGTQLINLPNLPATGTYTVEVSCAWGGPTCSGQLTLFSGVSGTLTTSATSPTYTANAGGQNIYMAFNAAAGDNLDLTFSNLNITGSTSGFQVNIYSPSGAQVVSFSCAVSNVNCTADLWNLVAGKYTIVVTPPSSNSVIGFTPSLLSEITGSALTVNSPIQLNVNENQGQRYTFTANAGDTYAMQLSGVSGQTMGVRIYSPSGPVTVSGYYTTFSTNGTQLINLPNLPATGTYTVEVSCAWGGPSCSGQLTLLPGVGGDLTVNATPPTYTTTAGGQNIYMAFTAAAGDNLQLTFSNLSITGSSSGFQVNVYAPSGSQVVSFPCSVSMVNCQAALWNLVAGTYTIIVTPPSGGSELSFRPYLMAELIEPPLTANTPVTLNVSEPQVQRYTFTAHAGDNYTLQVSGVSGQPITVAVYSPTVSSITLNDYLATMTTSSSQQISLSNLPATGTYTVLVGAGAGGPSSTGQMTLLSQ